MRRLLVLLCAAPILAACGGSNPSGAQAPPSAQSVASSSSDFKGVQQCPETGSEDSYLTAEKTKAPDQYAKDSKDWTDLKASGANDGYVAVYADKTSDCSQFGSGTPTGKAGTVIAFRFKDSASAAASFKSQTSSFSLSDANVATIKAAGGTVEQGTATGMGANSILVTIAVGTTTIYVAVWQNKEFIAAILVYNLPLTDGAAVATKVNGRIR